MEKFNPNLKVGSILNNNEIMNTFKVANSGGMRRSLKTDSLVLISDHTRGIYDDKWFGNELHYTGMGLNGDQTLSKQNKTLFESDETKVQVFLFEVFEPKKYVYFGRVKLSGSPYQKYQRDNDGNNRKVWIFPLKIINQDFTINSKIIDNYKEINEKYINKLNISELKKQALERSTKNVSYRFAVKKTYIRDPFIAEYTKKISKGICQLCGNPAPFKDKFGKPYLESHHVNWLSKGGSDSIENTVALCPNCHRRMHIVQSEEDKKYLLKQIKKLNEDN